MNWHKFFIGTVVAVVSLTLVFGFMSVSYWFADHGHGTVFSAVITLLFIVGYGIYWGYRP